MKVIGIIAEYNPFHNGHKYQIEELKKQTNADYVVIAMSGNFVQRGVPALCDKYSRAKMALECGADLVFELPALWATASAELFAKGGVSLFCNTGVVNYLGFGAETDNLELLKQIAFILREEPVVYKNILSSYLKMGKNFPTARKLALLKIYSNHLQKKTTISDKNTSTPQTENPFFSPLNERLNAINNDYSHLKEILHLENNYTFQLDEILNSPNNILAIEYLKAIYEKTTKTSSSLKTPLSNHLVLHSLEQKDFFDSAKIEDHFSSAHSFLPLTPILIQRKGAGYHEKNMDTLHPSATAIRNFLLSCTTNNLYCENDTLKKTEINNNQMIMINKLQTDKNLDFSQQKNTTNPSQLSQTEQSTFPKEFLEKALPKQTLTILSQLMEEHAFLKDNDISSILGYRLLSLKKEGYTSFADCSMDLSNKITKNLRNYTNFTDFCEILKSKELTHTRISRTLLHILLNIQQTDYAFATDLKTVPYLRVLGFRKSATPLLSAIKKEASVPMITKVADASSILSTDAYALFEQDLFASDIYYQLLSQKTGQKPFNDFTHPIVMI